MRHHTVVRYGENGPYHYVSLGRDGGHPCEGCTFDCQHETPAGAYEHHREWVLDNLKVGSMSDTQRRCEVPSCGRWTARLVLEPDGYGSTVICEIHGDDRAVYAEHFFPEGQHRDAWVS